MGKELRRNAILGMIVQVAMVIGVEGMTIDKRQETVVPGASLVEGGAAVATALSSVAIDSTAAAAPSSAAAATSPAPSESATSITLTSLSTSSASSSSSVSSSISTSLSGSSGSVSQMSTSIATSTSSATSSSASAVSLENPINPPSPAPGGMAFILPAFVIIGVIFIVWLIHKTREYIYKLRAAEEEADTQSPDPSADAGGQGGLGAGRGGNRRDGRQGQGGGGGGGRQWKSKNKKKGWQELGSDGEGESEATDGDDDYSKEKYRGGGGDGGGDGGGYGYRYDNGDDRYSRVGEWQGSRKYRDRNRTRTRTRSGEEQSRHDVGGGRDGKGRYSPVRSGQREEYQEKVGSGNDRKRDERKERGSRKPVPISGEGGDGRTRRPHSKDGQDGRSRNVKSPERQRPPEVNDRDRDHERERERERDRRNRRKRDEGITDRSHADARRDVESRRQGPDAYEDEFDDRYISQVLMQAQMQAQGNQSQGESQGEGSGTTMSGDLGVQVGHPTSTTFAKGQSDVQTSTPIVTVEAATPVDTDAPSSHPGAAAPKPSRAHSARQAPLNLRARAASPTPVLSPPMHPTLFFHDAPSMMSLAGAVVGGGAGVGAISTDGSGTDLSSVAPSVAHARMPTIPSTAEKLAQSSATFAPPNQAAAGRGKTIRRVDTGANGSGTPSNSRIDSSRPRAAVRTPTGKTIRKVVPTAFPPSTPGTLSKRNSIAANSSRRANDTTPRNAADISTPTMRRTFTRTRDRADTGDTLASAGTGTGTPSGRKSTNVQRKKAEMARGKVEEILRESWSERAVVGSVMPISGLAGGGQDEEEEDEDAVYEEEGKYRRVGRDEVELHHAHAQPHTPTPRRGERSHADPSPGRPLSPGNIPLPGNTSPGLDDVEAMYGIEQRLAMLKRAEA